MKQNKYINYLSILIFIAAICVNSGCKTKKENELLPLLLAGAAVYSSIDRKAPAEVTNLKAQTNHTQVVLTWKDPVDTDYDHVEITWNPGGVKVQTVNAGKETLTALNLKNGTSYTFTVKTMDTSGNISSGKITKATPKPFAGSQVIHTIGNVSFNMRYVPSKIFMSGENDDGDKDNSGDALGSFDEPNGSKVKTSYWIAETEVTYELWKAVYMWATTDAGGGRRADGGVLYSFANPGNQGSDSCPASTSPVGTNQQPVTCINWRDAIIWMNALTEYHNAVEGTSFKCVYTSDSGYSTPIRTSTNSTTVTWDAGSVYSGTEDEPYVNPDANGFRIPKWNEWILAAKYIEDANNDGDIMDNGEFYPGTHVSGDSSNPADISTNSGNYAWYSTNSSSMTHEVGTKKANALGLYDMSGNVIEHLFDFQPDWIAWDLGRMMHGGSFADTRFTIHLGYFYSDGALPFYPYYKYDNVGIRPVRSE